MSRHLLGPASDFPIGQLRRIDVEGTPVCLARTDDAFYAVSDVCSHEGASLSEGDLLGDEVECPLHTSRFDLRTGAVRSLPAEEPVEAYRVTLEGDQVFLVL